MNHCFDDIEKFVARLHLAAEAYKEFERKKKKDGKKKDGKKGNLAQTYKLTNRSKCSRTLTQARSLEHEQKTKKTLKNKAGYKATRVACGWAAAVMEKVIGAFGQEL